jgi:hypothetical protein
MMKHLSWTFVLLVAAAGGSTLQPKERATLKGHIGDVWCGAIGAERHPPGHGQ